MSHERIALAHVVSTIQEYNARGFFSLELFEAMLWKIQQLRVGAEIIVRDAWYFMLNYNNNKFVVLKHAHNNNKNNKNLV